MASHRGRMGGIVREFVTGIYTLLHLKWITNKDLLYNQGTLLKVMWQPGWEGSIGWNGYMSESFAVYPGLSQYYLLISYTPT